MADVLYAQNDKGEKLAYINGQWVPAPGSMVAGLGEKFKGAAGNIPILSDIAGFQGKVIEKFFPQIMAATSGETLGFADEALAYKMAQSDVASGKANNFDEAYKNRYQQINSEMQAYRQINPSTSTALELAGGLLTGGIGAGRAAGLTGVKRLAALAGTGVGYGGLAGTGYAQPGERLQGAIGGVLTGGALGLAVPLAAQGARALLSPIARQIGRGAPRNLAQQEIIKNLERANMTPEQAGQYVRTLGPQGMAADIPALQPLARGITAVPGKAQQAGLKATAERAATRNQRVIQNIDNAISSDNFYNTIDDIMARQKSLSSPLYQKSMSSSANINNVVNYVDNALSKSKGKIANNIRKVSNMLSPNGVPETNMEALHNVKMEIDDMISAAKRQGQNNAVRQLSGIKNMLLKQMDLASPEYKQARAIFSNEASNKNALDLGMNFLKADSQITARAIKDMPQSEQEMFRIGVAKALKDKILSSPEGADAWKRVMGNEALRMKIRTAFPDSSSFNQFKQMMKRESIFARTRQMVSGGSPTARIEAEKADIGDLTAIARGDTVGAIISGIKKLLNRVTLPSEKIRNELADILFQKGFTSNQDMLTKLVGEISKLPKKNRDFMSQIIAMAITKQTTQSASSLPGQ